MNSLFNKGVISTTIRRIRTVGIVAGIILLVQVASSITGAILMETVIDGSYASRDYGAAELISSVPRICMIAAFVMTLTAFNFLNKKERTDFYHALPHKRKTIFVSTISGVVLSITVIAVVAVIVTVVLALMFSLSLIAPWDILIVLLNTIAGTFLVSTTVGFVMSITGKRFANIIVSLIVLFLPRILVLMFTGMVSVALPDGLVPFDVTTGLLSDYNVVSSTFIGLAVNKNILSFFYTMLLGFVFTVLGIYTYRRRKSEMAGVSAPNKKLQMVYRLLVGFSMFSFVTAIFAGVYLSGGLNEDLGVAVFVFTIIYIFCAIMYFLFELITTKSWLNVAKAIPGLAIVILASALVFGGMTIAYNKELNFCPDVSEIDSVSFGYQTEFAFIAPDLSDYLAKDIEKIEIKDREIIKIARDALVERIDKAKKGKSLDINIGSKYSLMTFNFNCDGKKVKRTVHIKAENYKKIENLYFDCLEKSMDNSLIEIREEDCYLVSDYLTQKESKIVLKSAVEELNRTTAKEWIERNKEESEYYTGLWINFEPSDYQEELNHSLFASYSSYFIDIPIEPITFPDTYKLYDDIILDKATDEDIDYDKVLSKLEIDWNIIRVYDENLNVIFADEVNDFDAYETVQDIVKNNSAKRPVEEGEAFVILNNYRKKFIKIPLENVKLSDFAKLFVAY